MLSTPLARLFAFSRIIILSTAIAFGAGLGHAADTAGSADPTFSNDQTTEGQVIQATPTANGKILVLRATNNGTDLLQLNHDGTLDTAFNPGALLLPGQATAFAVDAASGGIVVVGNGVSGISQVPIIKYKADGTQDASFQPGAYASPSDAGSIFAVAIDANGKILIGGSFDNYNSTPESGLARLNADGSLDTNFAPPTSGIVFSVALAVAVQTDSKVLAAGDVTISGTPTSGIIRLNADGTQDTSFTPQSLTMQDSVGQTVPINSGRKTAIALQSDGKIILGGSFTTVGTNSIAYLARLGTGGSVDQSFTPFESDVVEAVAVQPDDKIVIGGAFVNVSSETRRGVARLKADGELDLTFDPGTGPGGGGTPFVQTVAIDADGNVLVGGGFAGFGTATRDNLARLLGAAGGGGTSPFSATTLKINGSDQVTDFTPGADISFLVEQNYSPSSDVTVRVQTAPSATGPWTDIPGLTFSFVGSGTFVGDTSTYPTDPGTFFRAVATATGVAGESDSAAFGPFFGTAAGATPILTATDVTGKVNGTVPTNVVPGDVITYSFTVTNTGSADATNVVVKDTFDTADTTFQSATSGGSVSASTVTYTLSKLAAGASQSFSFNVKVNDNAPVDGRLVNSRVASITADDPAAPYAGSASVSFVLGVPPNTPFLRITDVSYSADSDATGATAVPGDKLTYNFTLRNIGTADAQNVVITAVLNGIKFKSANNGGVSNGSQVVFNVGTLPVSGIQSYQVKAKVASDAALDGHTVGFAVSRVTVNAPGANLDNQPGLNSSLLPPYQVTETSTSGALVGGTVTYTFTATNKSNASVSSAFVRVVIPQKTIFLNGGLLNGASEVAGSATFSSDAGGTVIFNLGSLAVGQSVKFEMVVRVAADVQPGSTLTLFPPTLTIPGNPVVYNELGSSTLLSSAPPATQPSLALSKIIPDGLTLKTLFAFGPKLAPQLQAFFPVFPIVTLGADGKPLKDEFGNPVLNFDQIDKLGAFLNPNVGENPDFATDSTQPFYTVNGVSNKVKTPYVTFALLLSNLGDAKADDIVIEDRVPAGFEFNPNGDGVTAHADLVIVNGQVADSTNFKYKKNDRTLKFTLPSKVKLDKPILVVYQLNVLSTGSGGPTPGAVVTTQGAKFTTSSISNGEVPAASDGQDVLIVTPIHFYLESKKPTGKNAPVEGRTKINIFYKNDGGQKTTDFRLVSVVPRGASYFRSVLLDGNEKERAADLSKGESVTPPAFGATSGAVTFRLGKLKPGQSGFVQVEYALQDDILSNNLLASHSAYVPAISYGGQLPTDARFDGPIARAAGRIIKDDNAPATGGAITTSATVATDPNLPRLFVGVTAPAAVREGQTFDYLMYIANPTNTTVQADELFFYLPNEVELAAPLDFNGSTDSDAGHPVVIFPTASTTAELYPILPHTALIRKVTVRAKTGTSGVNLLANAKSTAGFGSINNVNGKQIPIRIYALPEYLSGPVRTAVIGANDSFGLLANKISTSALASAGGTTAVPPLNGITIAEGTANLTLGAADAVSLNNGVAIIPLGAGKVIVLGPATGLVSGTGSSLITNDGAGLIAQGGGNLIAAGSGNLIAQGGGNLFGVTNLIGNAGGTLIAQGGGNFQPCSGILSKLITQDGAGLIAQGGGNILRGGGANLISDDGLGVVSNDGGSLVALNKTGLLGTSGLLAGSGLSNLVNGSAALIAQGGGNLIAQGGGNLIAQGGGNFIAAGAGNFLGSNGSPFGTSDASLALHSTQNGFIGVGASNLIGNAGGTLIGNAGGTVYDGAPSN